MTRIVCMRLLLFFLMFAPLLHAQDSVYCLKVHFLYGSKPRKAYRDTERKWFGGILGGHAGVEGDSAGILSLVPSGSFHKFTHADDPHSAFILQQESDFYGILGGDPDSVKKTVVCIPLTKEQKIKFDSISKAYTENTPYDYAFFGMRCGAATYDLLSQVDVLPKYSHSKTWRKIFYPRKVRKRVLKLAEKNNWKVERQPGNDKRKWEKDG